MKTFRLSVILILVCFFGVFAQTNPNDLNSGGEILNSNQESLNFLSTVINNNNQNNDNLQNGNVVNNGYNTVIIQQIGDYNNIYTNNKSQSSNLELTQLGNNNEINLNITAPDIQSNILQQGNNNSVFDNIYSTNLDVQLNLIQNGNNLQFNRIGVNSLTNKIKFVQEGSFKTITLISN